MIVYRAAVDSGVMVSLGVVSTCKSLVVVIVLVVAWLSVHLFCMHAYESSGVPGRFIGFRALFDSNYRQCSSMLAWCTPSLAEFPCTDELPSG